MRVFVFFDDQSCTIIGRPTEVVRALSRELGFEVLDSQPSSMAGGWFFWLDVPSGVHLPDFFNVRPWRPVGSR